MVTILEQIINEENIIEISKALSDAVSLSFENLSEESSKITLSEAKEEEPETGKKTEAPIISKITYSINPEELQTNTSVAFDYERFMNSGKGTVKKEEEEEYQATTKISDTESQMMTPPEAQETFSKFQYAVITGSSTELNHETLRKLSQEAMFNKGYFVLISANQLTSDYNLNLLL